MNTHFLKKLLFVKTLFWEFQKYFHFFCKSLREGKLPMVAGYFFGQNAPSRPKVVLGALFTPKSPSAFRSIIYEVNSMVLGAQNAFWSSKRVLEHFGDFGSPKTLEFDSISHSKSRAPKFGELFAPKCSVGALGALGVP